MTPLRIPFVAALLLTVLIALPAVGQATKPASRPATQAGPANLVLNGNFSRVGRDGLPLSWNTSGDSKSVAQSLQPLADADGTRFVRLACTRFENLGGYSHAMLAQTNGAGLAKGRTYEFSCRLRAKDIASRTVHVAMNQTRDWTPTGLHFDATLSRQWKTCRRVFTASQDVAETGRLQIWFTETGSLDVADVRLVELEPREASFTNVVPPAAGKNLVFNGDFEMETAGWSSMGIAAGWGDLAHLHGRLEFEAKGEQPRFLRIPMGDGKTPVLGFDYYEPVLRPQLRCLAGGVGWIKVEKGQWYTLSCSMRSSVEGVRAIYGVRQQEPQKQSIDEQRQVKLTMKWQRFSFSFKPTKPWLFVFAGPDLEKDQALDVDLASVQLESGQQATAFEPRKGVDAVLVPSGGSPIFVTGGDLWLSLYANNVTVRDDTLKVVAYDFDDQPHVLTDKPIELKAGYVMKEGVDLSSLPLGFYRVAIEGEICHPASSLRIAIVPPMKAKDTAWGINHAFSDPFLMGQAAKCGITWYRDWSIKWQHVEPEKSKVDWAVADPQIDRVRKLGLNVLPLLPPFPSAEWNSSAPEGLGGKGYPGTRVRQGYTPKDPASLGAFIESAAAHYKDRCNIYEFLNEPIYTDYALPGRPMGKDQPAPYKVQDYVDLLKVAAEAMRKGDPSCKVIGGIAGGPLTYTREVIAAGCLKQVDLFNLHIYPGSREPETYIGEMDALLALMDQAGGRKPIWITEFSYYGIDDRPYEPFTPRANSWAEERLLDSEAQCAQLTVRFLAVMLSHGVEKVFIHSGASGRLNAPNYECALFDAGGEPTKLFSALGAFNHIVGDRPRCLGYKAIGSSGHAVALTAAGEAEVVLLWDAEESKAIEAKAPSGSRVLDFMGNPLPADRPLKLSPSPIYLCLDKGRAAEFLKSL